MTHEKNPLQSGPMTLRTDRPISLVFKPETFQLCVSLAVTRKNAGNASYDLSRDHITDETAWRDLFREPDSSRPATGAFFVEVSTSTNTIPFALLDKVIVEPISIGGQSLAQAVRELLGMVPTERDPAPPDKKQVLQSTRRALRPSGRDAAVQRRAHPRARTKRRHGGTGPLRSSDKQRFDGSNTSSSRCAIFRRPPFATPSHARTRASSRSGNTSAIAAGPPRTRSV